MVTTLEKRPRISLDTLAEGRANARYTDPVEARTAPSEETLQAQAAASENSGLVSGMIAFLRQAARQIGIK